LTGGIDQKHPRGHAKIKGIFEGRKKEGYFYPDPGNFK
jgi:hypothetical protein